MLELTEYILKKQLSSSPPAEKKHTRKDPTRAIPAPTPMSVPASMRTHTKKVRSADQLRADEVCWAKMRAKKFMKYTQVICVPTMLDKLKKGIDKDQLKKICTVNLGPNQPAQCLSARFVGEDGGTLFLYFGRRVISNDSDDPPVCFLNLTTCGPC